MGFLQQRMAEAIPCRGLNPSEWMKWQPVSRPRRRAALVAGGAGQWKMLIRDMAAPAKGRRDMAPNGDACPSWGGMKRRRVARRGSDRKSAVEGKRVAVRVDLGGRRCIKNKIKRQRK